jgi:hypothetical protein
MHDERRIDRLEAQVARLDSQNRRLRRWGGVALATVGALLLMGQRTPSREVLRVGTLIADRVEIVDDAGRPRLTLRTEASGGQLQLHDEARAERATLAATVDGAYLALREKSGQAQGLLQVTTAGPYLALTHQGKGGRQRMELLAGDDHRLSLRFFGAGESPTYTVPPPGEKGQ